MKFNTDKLTDIEINLKPDHGATHVDVNVEFRHQHRPLQEDALDSIGVEEISCLDCAVSGQCLPGGLAMGDKLLFNTKVTRHRLVRKGKPLFKIGDKAGSLYIVHSGMLKSVRPGRKQPGQDDSEQVIGFALPGELVSLDYPFCDSHTTSSIALKTSVVCEIPIEKLEDFHHDMPNLPTQIRQLITDWQLLQWLRRQPPAERVAAFLLNMSSRLQQAGMSGTEIFLSMSRYDIGHYLDLPFKTVSDQLWIMQHEGMLEVDRRKVTLTDIDRIRAAITWSEQND